jgi:NAD(P)-dependent dehydrogenase (short-subunit alcohol dehydrogenase family)
VKYIEPSRELANLVLFRASAEADFITGCNYVIDGGFCCGTGGTYTIQNNEE